MMHRLARVVGLAAILLAGGVVQAQYGAVGRANRAVPSDLDWTRLNARVTNLPAAPVDAAISTHTGTVATLDLATSELLLVPDPQNGGLVAPASDDCPYINFCGIQSPRAGFEGIGRLDLRTWQVQTQP